MEPRNLHSNHSLVILIHSRAVGVLVVGAVWRGAARVAGSIRGGEREVARSEEDADHELTLLPASLISCLHDLA